MARYDARVRRHSTWDAQSYSGVAVARLMPNVSDEQAAAVVDEYGRLIARDVVPQLSGRTLRLFNHPVFRLPFDQRGEIVPFRLAVAIIAVSGLIVLVAASNVAAMLLGRGIVRSTELAVRIALGAGGRRLARQLVFESLIVTLIAAVAGVLLGNWMLGLFHTAAGELLGASQFPQRGDSFMNWPVAAGTVAAVILTMLLVGALPARHAVRANVAAMLSGDSGASTKGSMQLRYLIALPQVCLSVVFVSIGAALVRSVASADLLGRGYDAENVTLLDVELPRQTGGSPQASLDRNAREERVIRRILSQTSGGKLDSTALVGLLPDSPLPLPSGQSWIVKQDGFRFDGVHYQVPQLGVSPDYFEALGISVLKGRVFDYRDTAGAPRTVVVSEDLARLLWNSQEALGQFIGFHDPGSTDQPTWYQVIGIVHNVRRPLSEESRHPALYVSLEQDSDRWAFTLVAKSSLSQRETIDQLRSRVTSADPQLLTSNERSMQQTVRTLEAPRRILSALLSGAGALALLLAATGLYSTVSYSASRRTKEIGIRIALGARRSGIVWLLVRNGAALALAGITSGLMLTYVAIKVITATLKDIPAPDAPTLVLGPLLVWLITLFGCYLPARRASTADPMVSLRRL